MPREFSFPYPLQRRVLSWATYPTPAPRQRRSLHSYRTHSLPRKLWFPNTFLQRNLVVSQDVQRLSYQAFSPPPPRFCANCCANHTPHLVHRNAQLAQKRATCTETRNLHRNAQLAQKPPTLEKSPYTKRSAIILSCRSR